MRFRFNRLGVVVLVALSVVLAGCEDEEQAPSAPAAESGSAAGATDRAEWQVASVFSSTLPVLGETGRSVAERIALLSGGRIKLQLFDPGKLVPPLEVLAAVGAGTVDAGWSVPGSWFDRMPAVAFFSSPPFGADVAEYLAWLYEGQGLSLWRELYAEQGVVPVPCGYVPPEAAGWSREPLDNVGALKGRKLHQFGLGGLVVLQKLGATVHLLAAEDIYPALERAVLDGAQISVPSIDAKLGFPKVAKHYYFPGWHQQASVQELLVNQARWDALGDAERALVETVCRAA
ncbi:MAG: C4-dicarboxylate ABC transporter, partial [Gammaproteobacteria bacterium]|nr:C4-dicarboxylate ABC transporter [Gammaproteobacteria bacterium]NIT64397.1 C4-dicarboxylate ABC transporter [Gammaproteobacteria bacterium]NIV21325.1 C4-dicarboxylate ABC transporter [Gammaproteobacteria bacterium]NIY32977.1 C4-dicarboxylate ABC transporter [Gammaproteobacteria bacterium]